MADYTKTKSAPGRIYPDDAVEVTWNLVEPLVTPTQVKSRFLFGIPLVSAMKDPGTGKNQVYTDDMIKDCIDRAIAQAELDTGIDIFPKQLREKAAFDRHLYQQFGYFRTQHRPAASIEALTITPPTGNDLYAVPLEWIEAANMHTGQINIIPFGNSIAYGTPAAVAAGGALFLNLFSSMPWVPAFWQFAYTVGFPDGVLPRFVNELIGVNAAIDILSSLAATYARSTSHSLGIDGLSQSVSTPGPDIFTKRLNDLMDKQKRLAKKTKTHYGLTLFAGTI